MQVHHHRVIHYTLAGAVSGAATTGLGAAMLSPVDRDAFQPGAATIAGLIGGAVTHAALGGLAAFSGTRSVRQELAHLGSSTVLSGLTSGLVGGAILSAAGRYDHPGPGHMVLAGVVGGLTIGFVGGIVAGSLCLCRWGCWLGEKTAEGAEHLIDRAESSQRLQDEDV